MSTNWTETAREICVDALQHLGVLGEDESPSAADMQITLRGLDSVLKELPLVGYVWPKLSGEVALTWVSGQTIALPADYYDYPVAWRTINGQKAQLTPIPHAQWVQMPSRAATGETTHFYISPDNVFYCYPAPTSNPVVTLQYQKIVDDASVNVSPDLPQVWRNPLGYGVAHEVALKFGVSKDVRDAVEMRWTVKRKLALESAISAALIEFGVAD